MTNPEFPRTPADATAEYAADLAAYGSAWDHFNQPDVSTNGISAEMWKELDRKHFDDGFDDVEQYHDYELEADEIHEGISELHDVRKALIKALG